MAFIKNHKDVLIFFVLWLVIVNAFSLVALNRFNLTGDTAYSWIETGKYYQETGFAFETAHAQWDSFWILDVAQNGYYLRGENEIANVVFFPLYPALIKTVSFFVGNFIFAGWLISVACLLLSLVFLKKLIVQFYPQSDYREALIFMLIFPTAYFFNAVYTESLFLFLSLATLYYAKSDKVWLAAIFGLCASLTRVTGLLLFVPLVWDVLEKSNFKANKIFSLKHLFIFSVPLGTLLFFLYHKIQFGNFLLFFDVQSLWGRSFEINTDHFISLAPAAIVNLTLDVMFVLGVLGLSVYMWRKLDRGLALYMLSVLFVAIGTGTLMSIGRYVLILFPLFLLISSVKNMYLKFSWALISVMLFTLYSILFINHYWAG